MGRGTWLRGWLGVAAIVLALGILLALALVASGRADGSDAAGLVLGLAALAALTGARTEYRRAVASKVAQRDAERQAEDQRRQAAALRRQLETERRWRRELRNQLLKLERERGLLGDTDDVPSLILRTAMNLLGARKGLLLSRRDEDSDGDLDLLAVEGFEADPSHSAIAQRFAHEVIASDETVREDDPTIPGNQTPADREIENLVAIPIYIRDRFTGVVVCANKPGGFENHDDDVLLALGDHAGAALHNARLHGELRAAYLSTIAMLAEAVEAKDPFLRRHSSDTTRFVSGVARALGLSRKEREDLVFGSLLHDVGKIGISERILLKPAGLTQQERSVIELHPRIGYQIVRQVPALQGVAPAILHHHERFDGDGYPSKLTGEDIPLAARIVAVVDAFSAMTSDRPYRKARSREEAIGELERCAGTQFDPEIVRLFVEEVRRERPAGPDTGELLAEALSDPELEERRREDEPLLGFEGYSLTDSLTMLYGHRAFHELANAEAKRAAIQDRPFAVVLVELTEIAAINRDQGYAAGDEAIRSVARAVQLASLECGGTAARYSGRHVGIVIPRAEEKDAESCAEEIASELSEGPAVSIAHATWRPGESGNDVISRARAELGRPVVASAS